MTRSLPHQLSQRLSRQWPCRETQIRQLTALLDVGINHLLEKKYESNYYLNSLKYRRPQP